MKTAKVTDTLRIDYLNALSYEYADIRERELSIQNNSIALSEAENLAYIHGIAEALAIKSTVELFFNSDFPKVQLYAASSLSKFAETGNKKNIELSYFNLGFSYFAQGMFPEALQNFMASYEWQIKNKNTSEIYRVFAMIAAVHKENGNYEEFFSHIKKGYQLAIRTNNKELLSGTLFQMGEMYMKLEDYQKAVEYFREAFSMDTPELVLVRREWDVWVKLEYAETFSHLRMFDSAWHYLNHFKSIQNTETFKRVFPLSLGEWYFLQSNYVTALNHFEKGLNLNMVNHDKNQIMRALINIARCHSALNNPELAKQFADKAIVAAQSSNSIQVLRDSYEIIYKLFKKKEATDSAAF